MNVNVNVNVVVLVLVVLGLSACRSDEELAGPDLSSAALYCPADPPVAGDFICDPTAIPYCTYPTQELTCTCTMTSDGTHVLRCAPEFSDGGAPHD